MIAVDLRIWNKLQWIQDMSEIFAILYHVSGYLRQQGRDNDSHRHEYNA